MNLRDWQCVHPRYWNEAQTKSYIQDTTTNLAIGMAPVVQVISPLGAVNILLTLVVKVAQGNPSWVPEILDSMADVAEALENIELEPAPRVH